MGVAPRIPGGGGKFKKTFENLASAEKVLLWTNNNHTSEWGSGTADTGTQLYAAYCIAVKAYTSVSPQYVMENIVVRGARCCVTANDRSINRMVTFDGANITIGTPFPVTQHTGKVPSRIRFSVSKALKSNNIFAK